MGLDDGGQVAAGAAHVAPVGVVVEVGVFVDPYAVSACGAHAHVSGSVVGVADPGDVVGGGFEDASDVVGVVACVEPRRHGIVVEHGEQFVGVQAGGWMHSGCTAQQQA